VRNSGGVPPLSAYAYQSSVSLLLALMGAEGVAERMHTYAFADAGFFPYFATMY